MKQYSYLLLTLLACAAVVAGGCKKDEEVKQAEGRPFTPRIFNEVAIFPENPDSVRVLNSGDTLSFAGLQFSPAGKADITWKVNDSTTAKGENYAFVATTGGEFRIRVEVSYEGTVVSRYRDVFVIPASYQKKTAANVVMAYIGDTAGYKSLDFSKLTHLAYKIATINAAGTMDVSKGEPFRKAEALVGRAHLNGVPVLMGISGALSADGWSVSQSNTSAR